ncbi:hypothetical protein KSP39_PZI004320 [Platanthera zijinensis]|uniref:YTH domain-containing family protein n=1 Tax=Platanthera zijinensis TaxID=2320716 RepID=A0AAP0BUK3_9ASPA
MTGSVDFHKDMDFWQQDKWLGSFPVKWHVNKDVSNTSLRAISCWRTMNTNLSRAAGYARGMLSSAALYIWL